MSRNNHNVNPSIEGISDGIFSNLSTANWGSQLFLRIIENQTNHIELQQRKIDEQDSLIQELLEKIAKGKMIKK